MIEQTIDLEDIDPIDFWGINNNKLNIVKNYFPKLFIVVRGHLLKIRGDRDTIKLFEQKFEQLLQHYRHFNRINDENFHQIIQQDISLEQLKKNQDDVLLFGNNGKPIKARTQNQQKLVDISKKNDLIFATGPAGSGKTYTAIALAVRALKAREIRKIILSRPAVEAGENLGFLPGDLKDKIDPYLQPLYDALGDMIPAKKLQEFLEEGIIEIAPLAFMRGRTLSNAFVILDEAQNTTVPQLKMFLTRMGLNTKYIITGDETQIDLPKRQPSGLLQAMTILKKIKGIGMVQFEKSDIVRHQLVQAIVEAYDEAHEEEELRRIEKAKEKEIRKQAEKTEGK